MSEAEILFERRGGAGVITLNRPRALNALTLDMCIAMRAALDEWAADDAVRLVVVRSTGARAFCAGGDIRRITGADHAEAVEFFREEYRNNAAVHRFPKPYVSLIEGVVMGGGAGISMHGSHRVGGENTLFAMPETGIGLFPDVGSSYVLPRMPGETGTYLALTGARLRQADALWCGVLTHAVPETSFVELLQELAERDDVDAAVADFARAAAEPELPRHREAIDRCFSGDTVEEIVDRLDGDGSPWAQETAATIRSKSPTSLKLALALVRRGRDMEFDDCMRMEFRVVNRVLAGHDFREGVRAVIVDKDQAPRWQPSRLDEVSDAEVERHFMPLQGGELPLP